MDTFNNLPMPAKAGIALASGAGLMGTIALLTGGNTTVLLIIALGIVVVGAMLVAYKFVLKWLGKRKAAPLERGILNNSAASPNSISEPARRARLDDLRRSFEGGVEKFRASGKNIYSLPWYVLVGEPGSGKTEAIRHCNVGFPPGLQDQLQGAGGTLNMNWWFTNHAIILDTAGRLMFEEVEPGATSEWKEFLGMLLRGRPNCPINGLLLVIPADSLIRDTADSIERKAGKIAQQLDSIQRQLGVRFPVFIVITKSDLINGFREFFDTLADPQLQHQIMGWSNPAPLDQPFSPELVEKHLQTVAASLSKRRQGLLIDPVNTDDPNGRRVDQVDALYAFPESLLKIGPRLRRYLEMVFVAGEWSPKPLFLRGIYFTSSMREGSALDAELAEALKVPIESLPEGKVWERDRAYFLRDLFLQKVFKEKGLVTRASDTKKLQRRRKMAVLVTGIVGVFLLLGLTWYQSRTLDKGIRDQKEYWSAAHSEYLDSTEKYKWQLFAWDGKTAKYQGDLDIRGVNGKIPRGKFHAETYDQLQTRIDVPWIFKPLAAFSGEINQTRNSAYRAIYQESVLKPLMDAVRTKLRSENPEHWNDNATAALAQLIRIETYASKTSPASNADGSKINLEPLARYVLEKPEEFSAYQNKYGKALQASADWLYRKDGGGGEWPAPGLSAGAGNNGLAAITDGVKTFNAYWGQQIDLRSPRLAMIRSLVDSLEKYRKAEEEIATATQKMPEKLEEYNNIKDIWNDRFKTLQQARADADAACAGLEKDWPDGKPLASVFAAEVDRIIADATRAHQELISHLPADEKAKASTQLVNIRSDLKDALAKVPGMRARADAYPNQNKLPELDRLYLAKGQDLAKKQSRRYVIHHQLYTLADEQIKAAPPAGKFRFNSVAGALTTIDTEVTEKVIRPAELLPSAFTIDPDLIKRACNSSKAVSEIAARFKRQQLLDITLDNAPTDAQQVEQMVAGGAQGTLAYGKIPLTKWSAGGTFDRIYNPAAAAEYLQGWRAVGNQLPDPKTQAGSRVVEAAPLLKKYDGTRAPVTDYLNRYRDYWTKNVRDKLTVVVPSWRSFFTSPDTQGGWQEEAYNEIIKVNGTVREALNLVSQNLPIDPTTKQPVDPVLQKSFDDAIAAAKPLDKELLETIQINYNKLARNWRSLGTDADKARDVLLEMSPGKFQDEFLVLRRQNQPIIQKYISDFGYEMLRLLAEESKNVATLSLKQLKTLSRFPLAKPDDSPVLTVEEVGKARALISKVTIRTRVATPTVSTKIGEGGTTKIDEVDALLNTLRELDLGDDKGFVDHTAAILAALPDAQQQSRCTISWLEKGIQDDYAKLPNGKEVAFLTYSYGELMPGVKPGEMRPKTYPTIEDLGRPEKVAEVGKVAYPGEPIQIRLSSYPTLDAKDVFYYWPQMNQQQFAAWGGRWGLIRLLHEPNVRRIGDGHEWRIEVPVGKDRAFWLKLEFDKDLPGLPALQDWPGKTK